MRHIVALIIVSLLISCTGKELRQEPTPVRIVPLYSMFRDYAVADSLVRHGIFSNDSVELVAFMKTVSAKGVSDDLLEAWANSQPVAVFTPDVDSVFTDTLLVGRFLANILSNADENGLSLPNRRYATVVYGRPESVLFVDSVMLIALNHYLGSDYPGYSHWPLFMRHNKTPEALPYDLAEALVATSFPYTLHGDDATLLSRMVYEGAIIHAKMALVPQSDPAKALGYTDDEFKWLADNEHSIWHSMVQKQLLYDISEDVVSRIVSPAPEVSIVDPVSPGRVGRYIGYRIVESYIKNNPDKTLPYILSTEFYKGNSALVLSGYNPV